MTEPENRLWLALRGRRLNGVKFARQVVVGPYIVDFCARTPRLAIEVDGDTHTDQSRDDRRTSALARMGYRVIRFANSDIMTNIDGVLHDIGVALAATPHPTLSPPGRGLSDDRP